MIQQDPHAAHLVLETLNAKGWQRSSNRVVRRREPPTPGTFRAAVALMFFINGMLTGSWVARIPSVKAGLGLNDGVFGLALLAMAGGALVAMPLAGGLCARFGSQRVTQAATLLAAALLPVLALAPNLWSLVVVLLAFGLGHGGMDVGMNAQSIAVQKRYPTSIISSFHALFSTGGLAGAALGGWIAARGVVPWVHLLWMALGLGGVATLTFAYLLDDRRDHATGAGDEVEASPRMFVRPTRALAVLGVLGFCAMVGEGAMADWSAIYLKRVLGTGVGLAAAGYASFSVAMAAVRFTGDRLSTHLGPTGLVRLGGALAMAGFAVALFVPYPAAALAGFAGVGAGLATVVPMVFAAAGRTPGMPAGLALSSVTTLGYLGFLLGPPIIGFASEVVGLRDALLILVLSSLLVVALASSVRDRRAHCQAARTINPTARE